MKEVPSLKPSGSLFRGRRSVAIENHDLRLTVLEEGGHIAEVLDKVAGISPLWMPSWPSIEPSTFDPKATRTYGHGIDAILLAGIMGHNLCLDIFGAPSDEEAAAGLTPHGEASIVPYQLDWTPASLRAEAQLPLARLRVERLIDLHGRAVRVRETVENLSNCDRPVAWTQHVTLGPPFLQKGSTLFNASATRSKTYEGAFGTDDYLVANAEFMWPFAPKADGEQADLRVFTNRSSSSAYTAHLMDPQHEDAFFVAFSPEARLAFGYVWKQREFPWMGIWEENHSRAHAPWNGTTLTRGMEFGVSPFPESRRQMIDRGRMFDVPTYRWLPARRKVVVEYWIVLQPADAPPESLARPGRI